MQKIFENYKGVILFYLVIVIFTFIYIIRINSLNNITDSEDIYNNYYAYNTNNK